MWAPVYGNHGARHHPDDAPDASYRRTRDLLLRAERAGFDATLVAQHVIHPSDVEDDVLETWSTLAALAEATSRIELIGAIKPLLFNPLVFAKLAANIADDRRRPAVDQRRQRLVSARNWRRSASTCSTTTTATPTPGSGSTRSPACGPVSTSRSVQGTASPRSCARCPARLPPVYVGGESEPGRALAAETGDVFFINGRPLAETAAVIEDLRARTARTGAPLRFGLSAFVITRDTEAEALAELEHLQALVDAEKRPEISGGTDPKTQMYKVLADTSRVGSNGGTLAGLVGSHDQVAERIAAFHDAGIELFMLQFQPLEAELDRFAAHIIPRFRVHSRCRHDLKEPSMTLVDEAADVPVAQRLDALIADRGRVARTPTPLPNETGCCSTTRVTALRGTGVLGLRVPARYGGPGGSVRDVLTAVVRIARAVPMSRRHFARISASPSGC